MKNRKKPKQILASEVLMHVAKTGTPYPLPADYDHDMVNDCVPSLLWNEQAFVSVSKSWFSRFCGVDGGQVSRWLRAGMPVLADGRLLWAEVDEWLEAYRDEDPARRQRKGRPLTSDESAQLRAAIERYEKENDE